MNEKGKNILIYSILAIIMIIAIVIVIINPNKTETINDKQNTQKEEFQEPETEQIENDILTEEEIQNMLKEEERQISMQKGGKFCKIGNTVVFYEEQNKSIYGYNIESNIVNKIATIEEGVNKIYFDGEYIYYVPYYYIGKGIYKIDLQGNMKKIYDGSSLQLWITDNEIYFVKQIGFDDINQNPQGTICKMDKEGNNIVDIAENIKNNFFIKNNKIYYTTQDRKMYEINIDGTQQNELVQGRKFAIAVEDKYLIYIDYMVQEAAHIINLETKEDILMGHFGMLKQYAGKTYINVRKRLDDGSLDEEFTLFEIKNNSKIREIGKVADFRTDIKYIINDIAYMYNSQEGFYTINLNDLENSEKQVLESYNYRFFIGGYAYKINDTNLEDIKIEMRHLR